MGDLTPPPLVRLKIITHEPRPNFAYSYTEAHDDGDYVTYTDALAHAERLKATLKAIKKAQAKLAQIAEMPIAPISDESAGIRNGKTLISAKSAARQALAAIDGVLNPPSAPRADP